MCQYNCCIQQTTPRLGNLLARRLFCLFSGSSSLPHAKHICTRVQCFGRNSILSQIHLITGTAIDVAPGALCCSEDDNDDDAFRSTAYTTSFSEPCNEVGLNSGKMILDFEQSQIGGGCGGGAGYHEMEYEGLGMSGQEQLFLRRVLMGENDHDEGLGFIWQDEDECCGICRLIHALILCA